MRGTLVLDNASGRALRRRAAAVRATSVLDCAGDFQAGDEVYVTFRAVDGGQYVVATGIAGCDAGTLRAAASGSGNADIIVIAEPDLQLLWPPAG